MQERNLSFYSINVAYYEETKPVTRVGEVCLEGVTTTTSQALLKQTALICRRLNQCTAAEI